MNRRIKPNKTISPVHTTALSKFRTIHLGHIGSFILILVIGLIVYRDSFNGVFVFDDYYILNTPQLHKLLPVTDVIRGSNRPVFQFSLALNYAVSADHVWSYHAFNLAVHILAALVLFSWVKGTFQYSPRLKHRYAEKAEILGLSVALLWMVHPLTTASVTYVIQRAESLMGLFYLTTCYAVLRSLQGPADSRRYRFWCGVAALACALGMGSKEVMVTAPIVALLYERIFFAESYKAIITRRWRFYLALAATWLIPLSFLTQTHTYQETAGFGLKEVSALEYALSQPGVILHYLHLSFYPDTLCLDHLWPVAQSLGDILIPGVIVGMFLILTGFALRCWPPLGFLGAWFFIILSVSSSFIPIQDLAFEHRMYLSLMAVITAVVVLFEYIIFQKLLLTKKIRCYVAISALMSGALILGALTDKRNEDYQSEVKIWLDTIKKRPHNFRAYNELGLALMKERRYEEARKVLQQAIHMRPGYVKPYNNLGLTFVQQGQFKESIPFFEKALSLKPDYAEVYNNLGLTYHHLGQLNQAIEQYEAAIRCTPEYGEAYNNAGVIYLQKGDYEKAKSFFLETAKLQPDYEPVYLNLALTAFQLADYIHAQQYLETALKRKPQYPKALILYGLVLHQLGRNEEAVSKLQEALRLDPTNPEAQRYYQDIQSWIKNSQFP